MAYNLDDVMRRAQMDPNDIIKHSKLQLMLKYQQAKEDNPNLTQDQLCGMIGTSKSKVYRNRIDLNMDSPHRYKVPVKHRSKPKPDPDHKTDDPDQDSDKKSRTKYDPNHDQREKSKTKKKVQKSAKP